eukprot:jgi/Psemu1/328655/estExt_fgenesh1_pg.C_18430001
MLPTSPPSEAVVPTATRKVESSSPPASVSGPKTRTWDNWPAIAYEEPGHALVTKGESFFNQARELYFQKQPSGKTLMDEFLEVYKNRPDPVNLCGIRINHAMALFLAVKHLKPTLVVESGVNAGVSTYFIRSASSTTKIFAIDPLDKPICAQGKRWIDSSDLTINYTGDNFVDLLDIDWKGMAERKEIYLDSTLVFIDDHLHAFQRIAGVLNCGIRHVVVEDNYKQGEGATPDDKKSTPKQMMDAPKFLDIDPTLKDRESYMQFMNYNQICHVELLPMPPILIATKYK